MRNRNRRARAVRPSRGAAALLVGLALVLAAGLARAVEPFENLMPDGCVFLVKVNSVPALLDPVEGLPHVPLFSEPAMQPFVNKLKEEAQEGFSEFARMLGVPPQDLLRMFRGQVCLGILPRGDRDAHYLLLADVSADPELAATIVENIVRYEREDGGYRITQEDFRGHAIYQFEPLAEQKQDEAPLPEAPEPEPDEMDFAWDEEEIERIENPGFIALSDGMLAVASSPDRTLLEKHLALRAGETLPTVGRSEYYRRVEPFLGESPDAVLFVDLQRAAQAATGSAFGPRLAEPLGIQQPPALGMGMSVTAEGTAAEGLLLVPSPRRGPVRALTPGTGTVLPPPYVDADSALLIGVHFSMPVLWEETKAALQRQSPQEYMMMEQQLRMMPVDIENGIIKAFGGRWFVYMPTPAPAADDEAVKAEIAVLADLRNAGAFATAWYQLLAQLPPMFQVDTIEFMGVKIQQFSMSMALQGAEVRLPQPCLAIMADKVLYSSGLELAKAIIRNDSRPASPLLHQEEFQTLLSRTMEDPDLLVHVNGKALGRMMRQAAERALRQGDEWPGPLGTEPEFGPEDIPWDVLEKYSASTILTAKWRDEGLLLKTWSPRPTPER